MVLQQCPVCEITCATSAVYHIDDTLSLKQQIRAYTRASVLVLGHCSGMVHILWMQPNATVIEIIPKERVCYGDGYRDGCRRLCALMHFKSHHIRVENNVCSVGQKEVLTTLSHTLQRRQLFPIPSPYKTCKKTINHVLSKKRRPNRATRKQYCRKRLIGSGSS